MFRYILQLTLLLIFFTQTACREAATHAHKSDSKQHHAHWGYQGEENPEYWGTLSPEFIKCAEGHFQSPIDLETYAAKKQKEATPILKFNYHPSGIDLVNNGHTVQANVEAKDEELIANGHAYSLKQIHFHAPAEHQLDGIIYPMEMHMVHADKNGRLAVVGVFIKEGLENETLQALWTKLPKQEQQHVHPKKECDILHLIPELHTVFHYAGSLTTPPCSEGVEWFVMKTPIELSKTQVEHFQELYHGNNRPIQKQEGRVIDKIEK